MANILDPSDLGDCLPINEREFPYSHNVSIDAMDDGNHKNDNRLRAVPDREVLGDVKTSQKYASLENPCTNTDPPRTLKKLNRFVRHHDFFCQLSLMPFTTSDRRKFERDIYDYGRSLGLSRTQAKKELVKARQFCGEEDYESDNSAWADEVNDSSATLERLSTEILEKNGASVKEVGGFSEGQNVVSIPDVADGFKIRKVETLGSDATKAEIGSNISLSETAIGTTIQEKNLKSLEIDNQMQGAKSTRKKRKLVLTQGTATGSIPTLEVQNQNSKKRKTGTDPDPAASKGTLNSSQLKKFDAVVPGTVNTQSKARAGVTPEPFPAHNVKRKPPRPRKTKNESSNSKFKDLQAALSASMGQLGKANFTYASNVKAQPGTLAGISPEKIVVAHNQIADPQAVVEGEKQVKQKELNGRKAKAKSSQNIVDEVSQEKTVDNTKEAGMEAPSFQELQDESIKNKAFENADLVSVTAADEGLSIKVEAPAVEECKDVSNVLDPPRTPDHNRRFLSNSNDSSPLSSALSSPEFPFEYTELNSADNHNHMNSQENGSPIQKRQTSKHVGTVSELGALQKARSSTISPYFLKSPSKKVKGEKISCIPFPPLDATSFGLVQETLCHEPFRLLIAVIFLNKTRGSVAMPVFYDLIARYPTPSDLAAAKHEEIVSVFQHLGLQNQRAIRCINLAKTWLETPPAKGKRHRRLHYPKKDDGKDIDINEGPIADDDDRIAWEVGHLLGIGSYAIDSWRIFSRDELRGLPTGLPTRQDLLQDPAVRETELAKEWTRVLPLDKELRAYLRWRWLRLGFEWDPLTGLRKEAAESVLANALGGGVICEDESGKLLGSPSTRDARLQDLLRGSEALRGDTLNGEVQGEVSGEGACLLEGDGVGGIGGVAGVEFRPVLLEPVVHGDSELEPVVHGDLEMEPMTRGDL